jgi:hypothetical protein
MRADSVCGLLDSYTRLQHVRGRNEAQANVAAALARRRSPGELLHGLSVLGQISPMDAPNASLYGQAAERWDPQPTDRNGQQRPAAGIIVSRAPDPDADYPPEVRAR